MWNDYVGASAASRQAVWSRFARISSTALPSPEQPRIQVSDSIGPGSAKGIGYQKFKDHIDDCKNTNGLCSKFRSEMEPRIAAIMNANPQTVIWQCGNELNGRESWSKFVRAYEQGIAANAAGEPASEPTGTIANDPNVIPFYVNMYLAPCVDLLTAYERASGKNILISLGSISSGSPGTIAFLSSIYNATFSQTGTALDGRPVRQSIEVIDAHYRYAGPDWLTSSQSLKAMVNGAAQLMSSEELGTRAADSGAGAVLFHRVLSRWLSSYSSAELGVLFWDAQLPIGTTYRLNDAAGLLNTFVGGSSLSLVGSVAVAGHSGVEARVFKSSTAGRWYATLATDRAATTGTVTSVEISIGEAASAASVTVYAYKAGVGAVVLPATIVAQAQSYTVTLSGGYTMGPDESVALFISRP